MNCSRYLFLLDPDSVNTILDAFFRQGANVNAINSAGETPLFKVHVTSQYLFLNILGHL